MNMNFGNEGGPFMSGHWFNPKTGDSFTVKDTYMEDNNIIVMTTDGRRMDYNMIQQYIKTEKPMPKQQQTVNEHVSEDIPDEVLAIMADADEALKPQPQEKRVSPEHPEPLRINNNLYTANPAAPAEFDEDMMLIKRLLKRAPEPTICCDIKWNNFPEEQIHMLDMMAVDDEKIADFYMSKVSLDDIRKVIVESIKQYIAYRMRPIEKDTSIGTKDEPRNKVSENTVKDPGEWAEPKKSTISKHAVIEEAKKKAKSIKKIEKTIK